MQFARLTGVAKMGFTGFTRDDMTLPVAQRRSDLNRAFKALIERGNR
jgi:hypothetical protein